MWLVNERSSGPHTAADESRVAGQVDRFEAEKPLRLDSTEDDESAHPDAVDDGNHWR